MIKIKLLLLSFLLLNVVAAFSAENKDNNTKDTLNISPVDTLAIKDTIMVVSADTALAQVPMPVSDSTSESDSRKGAYFLWIMIGILLVLAFIGFKIKHKD